MVCLVIEDGTIVPSANSYLTVEEAEEMLNTIGETFADTPDEVIKTKLLKATRVLESYRSKYKGTKVDPTQSLQFPRYDVTIDGFLIDADVIPYETKMAQAIIAMLYNNGTDVQTPSDGKTIIEESIGNAITVKYADNGTNNTINYPELDTYLKPLLKGNCSTKQLYRA